MCFFELFSGQPIYKTEECELGNIRTCEGKKPYSEMFFKVRG